MTNRLIKNEVIDIADRLEIMHTLMSKQTSQMNHLSYKVARLYNNQSVYDEDDDDEYGGESDEDQVSKKSKKAKSPTIKDCKSEDCCYY